MKFDFFFFLTFTTRLRENDNDDDDPSARRFVFYDHVVKTRGRRRLLRRGKPLSATGILRAGGETRRTASLPDITYTHPGQGTRVRLGFIVSPPPSHFHRRKMTAADVLKFCSPDYPQLVHPNLARAEGACPII